MGANCHQVQTAFTADVPAREASWPRPGVIHGLDLLAEFADVTKRLNAVLARSVPLLASPRPDTFLGRPRLNRSARTAIRTSFSVTGRSPKLTMSIWKTTLQDD